MTKKTNIKNVQSIRAIVRLALLVLITEVGFNALARGDTLYVGDASDDTVKAFDADGPEGKFQRVFVKKEAKSAIKGPMGLIFNSDGDLLLSNQNVDTEKPGEIRKHDGATGAFLGPLVSKSDENAPFAPRGIVLLKNNENDENDDVLFVASLNVKGKDAPPGRLLAYTGKGVFLGDLTPDPKNEFPGALSTGEFHPRGVVIGPNDGLLYVSVVHDLDTKSADFNASTPLAGWILRFDPNNNGAFVDVFASYPTCADLHRPEGLVFAPEPELDGSRRLYVTAFRADKHDTDKILIFNSTGVCVDKIDLDQPTPPDRPDDQPEEPRAFAQALLFGPGNFLFVPISGGGPDTGAVRRYNISNKTFTNLVPPAFVPPAAKGPLGAGLYLTFGKTDPGTLEYDPQN